MSGVADLDRLLATALAAADGAVCLIREHFGGDIQVNEAKAHDIKIQLDIDTQERISAILMNAWPGACILGEEGGKGTGGDGVEWIIDPIDGTVNFAYGIPHFCTSIAARVDGVVVCGVVADPMRREIFAARIGGGATLNGRPLHTSRRATLDEAIIALSFSKHEDLIRQAMELVGFYAPKVRKIRSMGAAALDLAYVAAGRFDAYIEQGIRIWDVAAGALLVKEAGGRIEQTAQPGFEVYKVTATNGCLSLPRTS